MINLPGVGANLQDRYEVTVVSELSKPLASLNTVSFKPGDPNDTARAQWFAKRTGLYATNGGTLAVIRRSQPAKDANEAGTGPFHLRSASRFSRILLELVARTLQSDLGREGRRTQDLELGHP